MKNQIYMAASYVLLILGTLVVSSTVRVVFMMGIAPPLSVFTWLVVSCIILFLGYKGIIKYSDRDDLDSKRKELVIIILVANFFSAVAELFTGGEINISHSITFIEMVISIFGILFVITIGRKHKKE